MENPSEASAAVEGSKDGGLTLATEVDDKGALSVLDGDVEKTYYVSAVPLHTAAFFPVAA